MKTTNLISVELKSKDIIKITCNACGKAAKCVDKGCAVACIKCNRWITKTIANTRLISD